MWICQVNSVQKNDKFGTEIALIAPHPIKHILQFILYFSILLATPAGFEPATCPLGESFSIQLRYSDIFFYHPDLKRFYSNLKAVNSCIIDIYPPN
jgi:hypothetical protein|tara:strand:- start:414 stop:701 length:288 start_codon:yes stop_codon:yes gene_type:complete